MQTHRPVFLHTHFVQNKGERIPVVRMRGAGDVRAQRSKQLSRCSASHEHRGFDFTKLRILNRTIGKLTYSQNRDSSAPARIVSIGFATGWGRVVEYIKSGTDFNNARLGKASSAEGVSSPPPSAQTPSRQWINRAPPRNPVQMFDDALRGPNSRAHWRLVNTVTTKSERARLLSQGRFTLNGAGIWRMGELAMKVACPSGGRVELSVVVCLVFVEIEEAGVRREGGHRAFLQKRAGGTRRYRTAGRFRVELIRRIRKEAPAAKDGSA